MTVAGVYRGLMIALPVKEWVELQALATTALAELRKDCAGRVKLRRYAKSRRAPKKPAARSNDGTPHVSTARLLAKRKQVRPKRGKVLHQKHREWGGSIQLAAWFAIELLWLPKRMPQLNPMDTLWGQGKDVICADQQYSNLDEQVDRFRRYLEGLSPQAALHTAGVLADDFWLRDVL